MLRTSLILLLVLSMSGCFWNTKKIDPVVVDTRNESISLFHPAVPNKISVPWSDDNWIVLTPEILEEYVDAYRAGDAPALVVYALRVDKYEQLGVNMAKLKKLVKDQKVIIIHYRKY